LYIFGLEIQVLEDNKKLEKILTTELLMPTIKRATMKIAGFSMCRILKIFQKNSIFFSKAVFVVYLSPDLWYQMMYPPNFDPSKKYPLFIQV